MHYLSAILEVCEQEANDRHARGWDRLFKNPMATAAAVDRLAHHSVILEFAEIESYRSQKDQAECCQAS